MTLQKDIENKINIEESELREVLLNFVIDIDENKISLVKIKQNLLEDVRELVHEEIGG